MNLFKSSFVAAALGLLLAATACAPGIDGVNVVQPSAVIDASSALNFDGPIEIEPVRMRPIRLPDLSVAADFSNLVDNTLADFSAPADGVELVTACEEEGGVLVYDDHQQSAQFSNIDVPDAELAFSIEPDGAGELYAANNDDRVRLVTDGDGTGDYVAETAESLISIEVDNAGVGRYYQREGDDLLTVDVAGDGSGVYYRRSADSLVTVTLHRDGSAELFDAGPVAVTTVAANVDGSGEFFHKNPAASTTVLVRPDGSWEQGQESAEHSTSLRVNADGSGAYHERGARSFAVQFTAEGASDHGFVHVPTRPEFVVDVAFPHLGSLSALRPRCATVLRLDTQLLFGFGEHRLKEQARPMIKALSEALNEVAKPIEIVGHTDSIGEEADNIELSMLRAEAVHDALIAYDLRVDTEVLGMGEAEAVAPNTLADGSDNPVGRAANRRVEVVIRDADYSEN